MGLAGKPQGMDGGEVEKYYRDGRIKEIAQYCESDVINTYRVWPRYELFRSVRLAAMNCRRTVRLQGLHRATDVVQRYYAV
jgi:predicted PolB exonuclease-like 3'-5' exonuclease